MILTRQYRRGEKIGKGLQFVVFNVGDRRIFLDRVRFTKALGFFHNVATIKGSEIIRHSDKSTSIFQEASSHVVCSQEVDIREDVYITDI